jgi:glucokinase
MSVIAIDMGGTVIKAARVEQGSCGRVRTIQAQSAQGTAQALPRLAELIRQFDLTDISGVGLALPTLVDAKNTRVLVDMKGKYEGLFGIDLAQWARDEFGLPIRIENDAHAALLGEWRCGSGRGCGDLVMITLGTGIGTSAIIQGKPLRGRHSQAGNLGGHIVIDPDGFPCGCGGRGCIEAEQHLNAVNQLARQDAAYADSALSKLARFDYRQLFELADSDDLSRRLRDRTLSIWGGLIVSLIHVFDCERVIVGGGIMNSREAIVPSLQAAADRALTPWGRVQVVATELGDSAALLGMASLFETPTDYL